MNFKEEYVKYNEAIRPARGLVEEMKEIVREQEEKKHLALFRVAGRLATAAVWVCILVGAPVFAANVDPIYDIMYRFSPKLAQEFRLVRESDEYQGIRMEVVSAYVQENELQIYLTLQDLEGDRIDGTTSLLRECSVWADMDYGEAGVYGGGGYKPVEYDEETGTATFLITRGIIGESDSFTGKKITVFLGGFMSQKAEYDRLEVPIPWSVVQMEPETMELWISGSSGGYPYRHGKESDMPANYGYFLLPGEPDERLGVEGIDFTGMGYLNGMLHIQTTVYDNLHNDNHCELFLVDSQGNRRIYDHKISGEGERDEQGIKTSYQDCIFDVSPEELENYTLEGDFVTSGFQMNGKWSVTFRLE